MPKFKIAIQDNQTIIKAKVFEAKDLDEAMYMAECEDWSSSDWETLDEYSTAEFREDLFEGKDTENDQANS